MTHESRWIISARYAFLVLVCLEFLVPIYWMLSNL